RRRKHICNRLLQRRGTRQAMRQLSLSSSHPARGSDTTTLLVVLSLHSAGDVTVYASVVCSIKRHDGRHDDCRLTCHVTRRTLHSGPAYWPAPPGKMGSRLPIHFPVAIAAVQSAISASLMTPRGSWRAS